MMLTKSNAIWLLLLLGPLTPTAVWAAPQSQMTAAELRALLGESQQRIKSLYVVYVSNDYEAESLPAGYFLRRTVACQSPGTLYHWTSHGHDALSWQDDSGQQIARVCDGAVVNEYPLNQSYYEASLDLEKDGLPGTLPNELLFSTVGFWPFTAVKAPRLDGEPFVLPEIAQDENYNHVRPMLEEVEGRWCHVLERKDRDRLWLDVDRGCAMLARETHSPLTGRLAQRVELGEHREFAPGIWFPQWIRNIQYDHGASKPNRQKRVWKNAKHDFLEVRINQLGNNAFQWKSPNGALRIFDDEPSVQVTAGGLEHLDNLADWIRRTHTVAPIPNRQLLPTAYGLVGAATIIAVIESVIYAFSRGNLRKTRQAPRDLWA